MSDLPRRLEEAATALVGGQEGVGLALGVVGTERPDGVLRFFGDPPPDAHTLYELASCTKPFTALLFELWLGRRPELADARIGDFLPAGASPVAESLRSIPLRAVTDFTSGLPSDNVYPPDRPPHCLRRPEPYGVLDLFEHLAEPDFTPGPGGVAYAYSSLGYALLAESLALAVGESFADLLASSVLEPLGMTETGVMDESARERMPPAIDRDGERVTPGSGGFPAHYGSAGLVSTPGDLATWLRLHMGYLPGHPFGFLLPNLQQPTTDIRTHAGLQAGRGWFVKDVETPAGTLRVVLKTGGLEAFKSFIAFVAAPRPGILPSPLGLFALTNAHRDIRAFGIEALGLLAEERQATRRSATRAAGTAGTGGPRVSYGFPVLATDAGHAGGGIVKFQALEEHFPNTGDTTGFDVLCLVSSRLPADAVEQAEAARAGGARLLLNQASAATRATHGDRFRELNRPLVRLHRTADHVVYQSEYARRLAASHLGPRDGPWEVLYNAVDTRFFTPAPSGLEGEGRPDGCVVLLGGTQYRRYRLENALAAFAAFRRHRPDARLLVSGQLVWIPDQGEARRQANGWVEELGLADHVTFLGSYTQRQAPEVFRRAHVLLHPMMLDCCPTVVIEAMACGLPVVYGASGGVLELVGPEAGVPVPTRGDWEHHEPPEPEELARALAVAFEDRARLGAAGRRRAVERFDRGPWLARHKELIRDLAVPGRVA